MEQHLKEKLIKQPRCLNCGNSSSAPLINRTVNCCEDPNYITFEDLAARERSLFVLLMKAELELKKRHSYQEDADRILNSINNFKNGYLERK